MAEGEPGTREGGQRELNDRERCAIANMARQRAVVSALQPAAGPSFPKDDPRSRADSVAECTAWMAMERQARVYLRHMEPSSRPLPEEFLALQAAHHDEIVTMLGRASAAVAGFDEDTRSEAVGRLGIRLAITGKGGAGKTFMSSVVARTLAQRGRRVLAVDLDTCPGLAISLGVGSGDEGALPLEALEENPGASYGWQLGQAYTPREVVDNFAVEGPDGVRFLSLGKIASEDKLAAKRSVVALVQLLLGFGDAEWDVIADMEAGPTTPFERYHSFSDLMLVVYGPAWRSAMTARRLLTVVGPRRSELIANRFRDELEPPGLSPLARIPADPEVAEVERLGLAPMDACPDAPAVAAVRRLTETHLLDRALNQPKEAVSP